MSMPYAPTKLRVPPGFEHLLEGLTREVLRSQPKDIIAFSAEYFRKKIVLRDGKQRVGNFHGVVYVMHETNFQIW